MAQQQSLISFCTTELKFQRLLLRRNQPFTRACSVAFILTASFGAMWMRDQHLNCVWIAFSSFYRIELFCINACFSHTFFSGPNPLSGSRAAVHTLGLIRHGGIWMRALFDRVFRFLREICHVTRFHRITKSPSIKSIGSLSGFRSKVYHPQSRLPSIGKS